MAQLVARLVRNEKVGGSNPASPTTTQAELRFRLFIFPHPMIAKRAAERTESAGRNTKSHILS